MPTLILIGERDDWNFARDCRDMMARRKTFSAPMRLVVYPEAQHSFNLRLPPTVGALVKAISGASQLSSIRNARSN